MHSRCKARSESLDSGRSRSRLGAKSGVLGRTSKSQYSIDRPSIRCTLSVYTGGDIMKHVGIKQARQELPDLIDRAEAGEEVIITRQGKAVAKLVAAPKTLKPLPSLAEFRHGIGRPRTPAVQLLREERNAR
jgi:prevent-host-death family protein